jgi:hypothetical protein
MSVYIILFISENVLQVVLHKLDSERAFFAK